MISVHNVPYVLKRIRHVFPHRPSWIFSIRTFPHFSNDAHGFVEKSRTTAAQPAALSRDGKILTGRAEGNNIYRLQISAVQPMHISVVFHFGQPFFRHTDGKRLDLRSPYRRDPRHFPGQGKSANAIKKAAQCKSLMLQTARLRSVPPVRFEPCFRLPDTRFLRPHREWGSYSPTPGCRSHSSSRSAAQCGSKLWR